MRRLVLTLAAYAVFVPAAHSQSAQPAAPTVSTAKSRVRQLLALSKRKDSQAVSQVAKSLTTDPEPINRRIAALVLEKIVDASTTTVVRGYAIAALRHALHDTDRKVQQTATKVLATLTSVVPVPSPPTVPTQAGPSAPTGSVLPAVTAFLGGSVCTPTAPVIVGAQNLTTNPFDVCVAFERAATRVAWPSSLSTSSPVALRVTLDNLVHARQTLRCHVTIATFHGGKQSSTTGSASVTHSASAADIRSAEQDCVEAVVEHLLLTKVVPALPQVTGVSAPGAATPALGAPAPAPRSPTPAVGAATAPDVSTE